MGAILDRRRLLGLSAGAGAAVVLGALDAAPAGAAPRGPGLPPVPGMLGDRRANELWYQFDLATWHEASQEFKDAWAAVKTHVGTDDAEMAMVRAWMDDMRSPDYPNAYVELLAPVREHLRVISNVQLAVFDRYYRRDRRGLASAFADFGQGVLYDPRIDGVHSMNGEPAPAGYHIWHAVLRGQMFLGIDVREWAAIDRMVGLGWALQSIAKPSQTEPNPPLPKRVVRRESRRWLRMSTAELDRAFLSQPYPPPA
ncbi:hypothetical protein [Actinomadura algeriensis]|uniref:TAT (Twin-arginine translocation) pathway-exported protein n=1 Tax=Actinomadura algeriensis TaxID=1679523 RepID=A0ABR9JTK9_9ACTN|nr:hypothetical protein [Actinomadura algeriensis]MBE1533905.1 hypothetical protein [Actinomadura algeriensis]